MRSKLIYILSSYSLGEGDYIISTYTLLRAYVLLCTLIGSRVLCQYLNTK